MAAQYELLKELLNSGTKLDFGQEMFFKFYQAFILNDRWVQYIQGVGTTLLVTAIALALGVVLGSVVALVRVAHDQQRPGRRNPVLGFFNAVCQVYTTIIRGTPMMVQLLIMSMVIFSNSRNFTMVGALALGINSGAYVSEIIRGGLMAVDPGQMEAGRSLGLNYMTTMVVIVIPQAIRAVLPALGNEFIVLLKDTSLITVIGGKELLYAAQGIMNRTYEAMYPLLGVALIYLLLVMLPMWINFLLRTYAWMSLLEDNGLINNMLAAVGLPRIHMINTAGAVVLGMVYNYIPYMILPIYSVLTKIDNSVIEAAQDLGANNRNVFLKVVLPMSMPGVISGVTMVFVPAVSTFIISKMLGGGGNLLIGDLIDMQFLGSAYNPNLGSAISLVLMVIILICMGIMNQFDDGENVGGGMIL